MIGSRVLAVCRHPANGAGFYSFLPAFLWIYKLQDCLKTKNNNPAFFEFCRKIKKSRQNASINQYLFINAGKLLPVCHFGSTQRMWLRASMANLIIHGSILCLSVLKIEGHSVLFHHFSRESILRITPWILFLMDWNSQIRWIIFSENRFWNFEWNSW